MKRLLSFLLLLPLFASAQTPVSNNFQFNTPKAPDSRTHALTTVPPITSVPYASVSAANAAIPLDRRYEGLTVCIGTASNCTEHWYHGGTANANLVMKLVAPDWGLATTPLPVNKGGTGVTTPGLVAGSNVSITGTWPNQTISAAASGGGADSTTFQTRHRADSLFARAPRVFALTDYGYKADLKYYQTASMSTGSNSVSVSSGSFTSADIGKKMLIDGIGAGGADVLTTITGVSSGSVATVAVTATTTISGRNVRYCTDNGPAWQAAVNAATAAGGGKIVVPKGIGGVASPLVTSDNNGRNPNAQIYFPSQAFPYQSGGILKQAPVYVIEGEVPAGMLESGFLDTRADLYADGSIVESLLPRSAMSGEYPAVFGTKGITDYLGSFNAVDVYMKNVWVRTHHDAANGAYQSGIMLRHAINTVFDNCRADIDVSGFNSVTPVSPCIGIMGVQSNGGTVNEYRSCLTIGYGVGYAVGEHAYVENCGAFMGKIGIDFGEAGHASTVTRFLSQWNNYSMSGGQVVNGYGSGVHLVSPSAIVIERINTGKWYDAIGDVYDPGNIISGAFYYTTSQSGTGLTTNIIKTGGLRAKMIYMGDAPGAVTKIYSDAANRPTNATTGYLGFNQDNFTLEVKQADGSWQGVFSAERVFRQQFDNPNRGYSEAGKLIGVGGVNTGPYPFRVTDPASSAIEFWRDPSGGNTDGRFAMDVTGSTPALRVVNVNTTSVLASFPPLGGMVVGPNAPTTASALDVQSTTGFFYPPRMTAAQASALSPTAGACFFVTTTNGTFTAVGLWYYTGSVWTQL